MDIEKNKSTEKIRVVDFRKSFGTRPVHSGVSFTLYKGECLGLVGGSGTGKSVLLRSLIGLESPDSGQIFFDGSELTGISEDEWVPIRKRIAYVFQDGALFDSMTVFDNLAYPLLEHSQLTEEEIRIRIKKQLDEFGLSHSEDLLPASLSGGMQKRVGLARAMMLDPEVVLYDEPTAGLDPFNTKKIQDSILKLKQHGMTSILVTHDMPTALAVCERIMFLKEGKIVEELATNIIPREQDSQLFQFIQGEVP
jgi:phospholipid/cholesterol/gamma-HCH transport system ATP-binding protein